MGAAINYWPRLHPCLTDVARPNDVIRWSHNEFDDSHKLIVGVDYELNWRVPGGGVADIYESEVRLFFMRQEIELEEAYALGDLSLTAYIAELTRNQQELEEDLRWSIGPATETLDEYARSFVRGRPYRPENDPVPQNEWGNVY